MASLWAPDHSPLLSIAMFRKPHLPRLIHLLEQSLGPGGYTAKLGLESHGHTIVAVDGHCDPQRSHQDYRELGTFAPKERGTAGHTKSVATPALEGPLASGNRIWGDRIIGGKEFLFLFCTKTNIFGYFNPTLPSVLDFYPMQSKESQLLQKHSEKSTFTFIFNKER